MSSLRARQSLSVLLYRASAAIFGGYLLANATAILFSLLASKQSAEGVMFGMLASYFIYALTIMWVFHTKTVRQAWSAVLLTSLFCLMVVHSLRGPG